MCTFEKFYLHLSPAVIKSLVMFTNSKIIICILELKLYLAPAVIKLQMSKEWKNQTMSANSIPPISI